MSNMATIATFGRRGPSHGGYARMLGADPSATPPPDACSVQAWYDDPPLDTTTGKPTGGMKTSTMAYLMMGIPAVVGAAIGAFSWQKHRVGGGLIGAVVGFGAGVAGTTYQYKQWKDAGGAKHVKGSCDDVAGGYGTGTSSAPPQCIDNCGDVPGGSGSGA